MSNKNEDTFTGLTKGSNSQKPPASSSSSKDKNEQSISKISESEEDKGKKNKDKNTSLIAQQPQSLNSEFSKENELGTSDVFGSIDIVNAIYTCKETIEEDDFSNLLNFFIEKITTHNFAAGEIIINNSLGSISYFRHDEKSSILLKFEFILEPEHPRHKIRTPTCTVLNLEFKPSVKTKDIAHIIKKILVTRGHYVYTNPEPLLMPYKIWIKDDVLESSIRKVEKSKIQLIKGSSHLPIRKVKISTTGAILSKENALTLTIFSEIIRSGALSQDTIISLFNKKLVYHYFENALEYTATLSSMKENKAQTDFDSYLLFIPIYDENYKRYIRKDGPVTIVLDADLHFPSDRSLSVFCWWLTAEVKSFEKVITGPYFYNEDLICSDFIISDESPFPNAYSYPC